MSSETEADVPAVQDAARELSRSTGDFKQAVEKLQAELQRDEGCWSDDEIGKGFAEKYSDAGKVRENLAKLSDSLDNFATEGLPKAVESIQKLDSELGENLRKFADQVDDYKPGSDLPSDDSA